MNTSRIAMTAAERSMGRLMRAPDHGAGDAGGGGGGDSGAGGDNPGGNGAPGNPESQGGDNPGQEFDAGAFWNEPEPEGGKKPSDGDPNDSDPGREIGQQIAAGIKDFKFDPVFTQEVGEQLAEGKLDGANESFANMARASMQQSVVMSAKIMEHLGGQMMTQMKEMIDSRLGQEKNETTLLESFPSMKDPAMRPVVEGVFNQAMKHSGQDREKALQLTRNMLKAMGQTGKQDMGIEDPAPDPDSFMGDGPSQLVKDLLAR